MYGNTPSVCRSNRVWGDFECSPIPCQRGCDGRVSLSWWGRVPTGMTLAWELRKVGVPVTIHERKSSAGGSWQWVRIQRCVPLLQYITIIYQTISPVTVDEGPSVVFRSCPQLVPNLIQQRGFDFSNHIVHICSGHVWWQTVLQPFNGGLHVVQRGVEETRTDALY